MWRALVVAVGLAGCAAAGTPSVGGGGGGGDDHPDAAVSSPHDAHVSGTADAPHQTPVDAPVVTQPVDAAVSELDAPPGSLFCNDSSTCGAGDCCFDFGSPPGFCVPGTDVFGLCIPDTN